MTELQRREVQLLVIGGGPAGLAAAIAARDDGVSDIVILERNEELGGILQQCIHNGFGIHLFDLEMTGPEYADVFIEQMADRGIEYETNTMVIGLTQDRVVTAVNPRAGLVHYQADAIVLAMGCRERTRGAIRIPGTRPAGVYTAGMVQRLTNIEGFIPGEEIVILGSGDIGLIMARRLSLEGCDVKAVVEIMPYPGGLTRNIVQCLHDFDISLYLSHTVANIRGKNRVEGVTIAPVDGDMQPRMEEAFDVDCDTLVLSVGLIPENELSLQAGVQLDEVTGGPVVDQYRQTNVPGIFACGNVLHVHDLVDYVTEESRVAGRSAARYLVGPEGLPECQVQVTPGPGIRYVVPHRISGAEPVTLYMRVREPAKNVQLCIGEGVDRRRQRVVKPSEMVIHELESSKLERVAGSSQIKVSLSEAS